jgi:hypothetical protein
MKLGRTHESAKVNTNTKDITSTAISISIASNATYRVPRASSSVTSTLATTTPLSPAKAWASFSYLGARDYAEFPKKYIQKMNIRT